MKHRYKEIRRLGVEDLRNLCVYNNWCPNDVQEYEERLRLFGAKENLTTEDIIDMAEWIVDHCSTSAKRGDTVESIAWELAHECMVEFVRCEDSQSE